MRVPDQVLKTVVFVGLPEIPDPEYRGTAFIVTAPGTQSNHFAFMVTARHVAEKLEGNDFYIRANKKRGGMAELRGFADNPWWYHPTEREYVDCAVTLFSPARLAELDVEHIPIGLFADKEKIKAHKPSSEDQERKIKKSVVEAETLGQNEPVIIKSKTFSIKPMSVEEAVMQMDLLHKDFLVFTDSATEDINVIYRRKDGNYGLIEPHSA